MTEEQKQSLLLALTNARNAAEAAKEGEIADRCALYISRIRRNERAAEKMAKKTAAEEAARLEASTAKKAPKVST